MKDEFKRQQQKQTEGGLRCVSCHPRNYKSVSRKNARHTLKEETRKIQKNNQ